MKSTPCFLFGLTRPDTFFQKHKCIFWGRKARTRADLRVIFVAIFACIKIGHKRLYKLAGHILSSKVRSLGRCESSSLWEANSFANSIVDKDKT